MKIGLYTTHEGLTRMMMDLLSDHEIVKYNNSVYDTNKIEISNEEVIISTFPYKELGELPLNKKIIIYATDPFPNPGFLTQRSKYENIIIVGDGDGLGVYPQSLYPITPDFIIPHSINPDKYPKFKGEINAIAVCQRKPFERWAELTGATFNSLITLGEFLPDIPYHILHVPNNEDYFETVSRYRGVFYFSNNPYTLNMFELMAMNMPMVAFNNCRYSTKVMEKYLHNYSTKSEEVRGMLKNMLKTNKLEIYNLNNFQDAKDKWNEVIKYTYETK